MDFVFARSREKRTSCLLLSALYLVLTVGAFCAPPTLADPESDSRLKLPPSAPTPAQSKAPQWMPDTLLVMPSADAQSDEVMQLLKEADGEIVRTIGSGELLTYVVKIKKGKFAETEKKLTKDNKHFANIQRDYFFQADAAVAATTNDPYLPSEWHLGALNVTKAWDISLGGNNLNSVIAVLDTGTNGAIADLKGKTYAGFDAINRTEGQQDVLGHGTMVATTAAAITNNGVNTAAPARLSWVYPIRIGTASGGVSSAAIMEGILKAGNSGIKIINISANGTAPFTMSNKILNGTLHTYFKWFHDTKKGLIFLSAGNSPIFDPNPMQPYLIVVSAIDTNYSLASFSTYGNPVWFTAPGTSIYCSNRDGRVASVSGTSFSCPLTAAIAAYIWGARPSLTNLQVENILRSTCFKAGTATWTKWYGYGMPNAEAAIKTTLGR
jgi:thermitase